MSDRSRALAHAKIVVLIGSFARGGAERQAYLLARELRHAHGLNVEVWAMMQAADYGQEDRSDYAQAFRDVGLPVRLLGFTPPDYYRLRIRHLPVLLRRLWRVGRQLKEGGVHVLLPFTTWPNVLAGLTYRLGGVKLCIWGERHCGLERVWGLEQLAVRQYRQFVANSSAGVEFLARDMGVSRRKIALVPNGVEASSGGAQTDWRVRLGVSVGTPVVVMVGNLSRHKDQPTLLRAWKRVQDAWSGSGDRPYLALAGYRGTRFAECESIVRDAAISSSVAFLGSIEDVPALVAAADLIVFSSLLEGMPNGVLEGMAAGKAVIATDLPGVRDALGDKADEVVVPKGDAVRMAEVLLDLLVDKQRRDLIGERNRQRILSEFTVARMAGTYRSVIETNLPKTFSFHTPCSVLPAPEAAGPPSSALMAAHKKKNN